jgi:predicted NAD/FAD-binding protein
MNAGDEATASLASARHSVAVVGSGVSGLTAAYLLGRTHDVTLFEAENRLGGHAHTHDLIASDGSEHAVDSGFIVHNDRTYPWLRKLFAELDVEVRPTEMSMSVRCEGGACGACLPSHAASSTRGSCACCCRSGVSIAAPRRS